MHSGTQRDLGGELRGRLTLLCVDLGPDVQVDAHDYQVAEQVESAAGVEHIGIFEGDPLGHLHHTQDDDDVGSACDGIMSVLHRKRARWQKQVGGGCRVRRCPRCRILLRLTLGDLGRPF